MNPTTQARRSSPPTESRRHLTLEVLLIGALLSLQAFDALEGAQTRETPRKKLIEVGWDMPDTAFLREHWQEMERTAPFDGLNFYVTAAKPAGARRLAEDLGWFALAARLV